MSNLRWESGSPTAFPLYVLDAMAQGGRGGLVSVDPFQLSDWGGRGLKRVQSAGFSSRHEFIGETSWQALPRLTGDGRRFEFAFIDGSHAFDNAFVDLYLVDKLISTGVFYCFRCCRAGRRREGGSLVCGNS